MENLQIRITNNLKREIETCGKSKSQIANELGIEAYGVASDPRQYVGATYREIREILARNKDFVQCIFKPKPTYLGEEIPVSGNGNVTND